MKRLAPDIVASDIALSAGSLLWPCASTSWSCPPRTASRQVCTIQRCCYYYFVGNSLQMFALQRWFPLAPLYMSTGALYHVHVWKYLVLAVVGRCPLSPRPGRREISGCVHAPLVPRSGHHYCTPATQRVATHHWPAQRVRQPPPFVCGRRRSLKWRQHIDRFLII